jgi:hypothetical protein
MKIYAVLWFIEQENIFFINLIRSTDWCKNFYIWKKKISIYFDHKGSPYLNNQKKILNPGMTIHAPIESPD